MNYQTGQEMHEVQLLIEPIVTEEGATFTPWTDGHALGYKVTAPGKPDRWIFLNPSTGDDSGLVDGTNAFVYIEAAEDTHENPYRYYYVWADEVAA